MTLASFLADYSQKVLAAAGCSSAFFIIAATFLEFDEHHFLVPRRLRVRYFRWWKSELIASRVVLDLCLFVTLLPVTLYVIFGITILTRAAGSLASLWYYAIGLTAVIGATLWGADATMRAKARERKAMREGMAAEEAAARKREEAAPPPGD